MNIPSCARDKLSEIVTIMFALTSVCTLAQPQAKHAEPASAMVRLQGNIAGYVVTGEDLGPTPPETRVPNAVILLARTSQKQVALARLIYEQHDQGSPSFRNWLTPEEFGQRFGASDVTVNTVGAWLQAQGLSFHISKGKSYIRLDATVGQLSTAFHTSFHSFRVHGQILYSPVIDPAVPINVAPAIRALSGLSTLSDYPEHYVIDLPRDADQPLGTGSTDIHYISPADFATIYDINPVYQDGYEGAGQNIAIVGESRVDTADVLNFAAATHLSLKPPIVVLPPKSVDPGETNDNLQVEATLDVTRANSVAPNAAIYLVINAASNGGVNLPIEYVIDNQVAPILSISFGQCEAKAGQGTTAFYDALFTQAAAEGITTFVAAGDGGVDSCEAPDSVPMATQVASINPRCASPNVTCVGGTEFNDPPDSTYWNPTNSAGLESATRYIPEGAFNDPINDSTNATQIFAGGGGVSMYIPAPAWQASLGAITGGYRAVPDVALSASGHDGYFICLGWEGYPCVPDAQGHMLLKTVAGTSAAAPSMAGIQALLNQEQGGPSGATNATLYALAATPSNQIFHDATVETSGVSDCTVSIPSMCNNSTPSPAALTGGAPGYLLQPGFDLVTGWGSIDVYRLLENWGSVPPLKSAAVNLTLSQTVVSAGQSITFSAMLYGRGVEPTGTVQFLVNGNAVGSPVLLVSGAASTTIEVIGTTQLNSVIALYSGDQIYAPAASSTAQFEIVPVGTSGFSLAATPITIATPGGSGTSTITVAPVAGFTGTVTFTCKTVSGLSLGTCSFTPATVILNGTPQITELTLTSESPSIGENVSWNDSPRLTTVSQNKTLAGGCVLCFFLVLIAPVRPFRGRAPIVILAVFVGLSLSACSRTSPTVTIVSALNPGKTQEPITFQASVTDPHGGPTPTGQVQFLSNGQTIGAPQSLANGSATFAQTFTQVGSFSISAEYLGSASYSYAVSQPISELVSYKNAGTLPGSYQIVVEATSGSTTQAIPVSVTVK